MPARKQVESCMFCEPEAPCPTHQPKAKKSAARRKTSAPSSASEIVDPVPSRPATADIASAMKAAVTDHTPMEVHIDKRGTRIESPDDDDFRYALNMLEPIMHPDERERYSFILDTPSSRALRWRERRGQL